MPLLFEPPFAESREPSVLPHIRVRLRLIHQVGVVLGMDAQGISSKIDVPGLLARVDAAYHRGHQGQSGNGNGGISSLPFPIRPMTEVKGMAMTLAMVESTSSGVVVVKNKGGDGGMMGMIRRFGRKNLDEASVGAAGWDTSILQLISGR
jgi:hypothetical protein